MDTILCDELLQEIFHRLPPPSSATISLVSKRFHLLLRSSLTSLILHLPHPFPPSLPSFLSSFTSLTSLAFSTTTPIPPSLLTPLSLSSPHLSSLSFTLSRPLPSLHFLTSFPQLNTLYLTLSNSPSLSIPVSSSTSGSDGILHLQALGLSCSGSGDIALNWLWTNCCCKTLTKLVLKNCGGIGENHEFGRFVTRLEKLQEVELKACRTIVSLFLYSLGRNTFGSLKSLCIYDGGDRESLMDFVRGTRCDLERLDLRLPMDLDDGHLVEIGARFTRLKALYLRSCCMVTGAGLKALGLGLGDHLVELGLTEYVIVNRQSGFLVELAQSLRNIKVLDLSYNHTLVDKEFGSMVSSCCGITKLKIRGCSGLTDVSLGSLCKNCKKLESVDVLYCHGMKAEGVEFMVLNLGELRKVKVEDWKVSEVARRWMKDKFIEVEN